MRKIWAPTLWTWWNWFKIGEVREEELATLTTVGDCVDFLAKKLDK